MKKVLSVISTELKSMGINYEFMRFRAKKINYPYFVGEIFEVETDLEDGKKEYSILLTGITRGSFEELLDAAGQIENHFPSAGGLISQMGDSCLAIYHDTSNTLASEDEELKKIQINLTAKIWKGGI